MKFSIEIQYKDYRYGRFGGINHEDKAQTDRNGNKIGHGGDVYYMCLRTNYGNSFASVFSGRWMPGPKPSTLRNRNPGTVPEIAQCILVSPRGFA